MDEGGDSEAGCEDEQNRQAVLLETGRSPGPETQGRPAVENLVLKRGGRLVEGRIHSPTTALEDPSAAL